MNNRLYDCALNVIHTYGTNDPFEIAADLGVIIERLPLGNMRGFLRGHANGYGIVINSDLNDEQARLTAAHELGHYFLHGGQNRVFLDTRTFSNNAKYEKQANTFAVWLLFPDDAELFALGSTYDEIQAITGVDRELLQLRFE